MMTSEHYSTNVQTFVPEDSQRGSDNFRRLPNVAVRSSKPWRDLVSFLLRTRNKKVNSILHAIVLYARDRLYVLSGHATLCFLLIVPWGTE